MKFGGSVGGSGLFFAAAIAAIIGALESDFLRIHTREGEERVRLRRVIGWATFFLTWEFLMAGLFLPLDFTYQTVIVFLSLLFFLDLVPQHFFGTLSREKLLATASVVFVMLTVALSSARWGL